MSRWGVFDQCSKAPIRRIGAKVKEINVRTMGITIERVIMLDIETTIVKKTSTGVAMVTEMIEMGPIFHLKIEKLILGMVEVVWCELKICYNRL